MSFKETLESLGTVLIIAGALLVIDAVATITWQEPISAIYTSVTQQALAGDLKQLESGAPTKVESRALKKIASSPRRVSFLARAQRRSAKPGEAVGRISAKAAGFDAIVVAGTATGDLRKGPGLYEQTAFPGAGGTTAIAGHRTTYGAPFRNINRLNPGDQIVVELPYARFVYRVQERKIVQPTEVGVIREVGYSRLVLTACHPLYSAAQRMVVFARQVDMQPRGAARGGKNMPIGGPARRLGGDGLSVAPPKLAPSAP